MDTADDTSRKQQEVRQKHGQHDLEAVCGSLDAVFLDYHRTLHSLLIAKDAAITGLGRGFYGMEEARLER